MRLSRAVVFCVAVVCAGITDGAEWSQFRGPNASGHAGDSAALPAEIGPETHVIWKTPLPPGHSSPVLSDKCVFVTAVEDKKLFTIAVDRADGKQLWKQEARHNGLEEIHTIGSHAQPTPATDGRIVVSFFGSCGLWCYNVDGTPLWKKSIGPFKNTFGAASSPIIVDDLVISNQDHDIDSYILAVNKRTGDEVWKTPRAEFPRGYSTPLVWDNEGHKQIVVLGALRIVGYDAQTGKEAWTVRGLARIANMTPVVGEDGTLYVAAWSPGGDETDRINAEPFDEFRAKYDKDNNNTIELSEVPAGPLQSRYPQIDRDKDGHITAEEYNWMRTIFNTARNVFVAIKPGGAGEITDSHVAWTQSKFMPYVPSPLFHEGYLYTIKNGGILACLEAGTGKRVREARVPNTESYYSSPVVGDGKIYLVNQQGALTVLTAEPDWKVLATAKFDEPVFATPALAGGRIYLRTAGHLYCFGEN